MELKDTIEMMNSPDYKERFKAEYMQTKIRYGKLNNMLERHRKGTLDFTPSCPIALLEYQADSMGSYLDALVMRAEIEGVPL